MRTNAQTYSNTYTTTTEMNIYLKQMMEYTAREYENAMWRAAEAARWFIQDYMCSVDEVNIDTNKDQIYVGDNVVESVWMKDKGRVTLQVFNENNGYYIHIDMDDVCGVELIDLAKYIAEL